jgi:molybdopterin-guanine dinucleotide biosynthesis protein A
VILPRLRSCSSGSDPASPCIISVVEPIAAFILAGGKSSRMGQDKAFLELEGETLLARAMALATTAASEVRLVGDAQKLLPFGRVVEDVFPERGPLGGIHAALANSAADLNLVLAVDLPFVEPRFLAYLLSAASQSGAVVTVPHAAGGWQPLCAVYRREFGPAAERALRKRRNKIDALFSQVETRVIGEEELARMGFSAEMFRNLNTLEDVERAAGLRAGRGRT